MQEKGFTKEKKELFELSFWTISGKSNGKVLEKLKLLYFGPFFAPTWVKKNFPKKVDSSTFLAASAK